MRLHEWQSAPFEGDKHLLSGFVDYLSEVWQNRLHFAEQDEISEEEEQEREIQRQRFFDFTIDGLISARNYVGVVQYEGLRVEVYPKIFASTKAEKASQWPLNLLYWLSYCQKIRFPFSLADVSTQPFDDLLELLIYLFAYHTASVIRQQPFQAYQEVEKEMSFLRGRLSFDNYVRQNLATGQWQYFQCIHEPFVYNNLFNRIIKHVTRRLLAVSRYSYNIEKLEEVLFILDDVTDVRCTAEDCERVRLNALYEDHRQILETCRLFLSGEVIDLGAEDTRNFCFLLPMEYIFEDFVSGFITVHWPLLGAKSQSRDWLAVNGGREVFQIRNDLYIKDRLIIDTKYKIRATDDGLKAGVSQGDLYQMISYSLRRNCREVLLLYPQPEAEQPVSQALLEIQSEMLQVRLCMHVVSIDITFRDIQRADETIRARMQRTHSIFEG